MSRSILLMLFFILIFCCKANSKDSSKIKDSKKSQDIKKENKQEESIDLEEIINKANTIFDSENKKFRLTKKISRGSLGDRPEEYLPTQLFSKDKISWTSNIYGLHISEWNKIISVLDQVLNESEYSKTFKWETKNFPFKIIYTNKSKEYSISVGLDLFQDGKLNLPIKFSTN